MAMRENKRSVESIFEEAQTLPVGEQRDAFLLEACDGDEDMLSELKGLLAAVTEADGFFEDGPPGQDSLISESVPASETLFSSVEIEESPGTVVGRYKLLEQIGEGGMGMVYSARQSVPVKRDVALKIIKRGMDTKQVVTRFEAERQALALMDHPNIARVFDAGATATGRPFFVMELVSGVPITEYCDQHRLPPDERLRLFIPVCQAIQHAHQKGVIHRDIKPSNVLVALRDGKPVPKIIDFGIAKATQQKLTEETLITHFQQFLGTPAYMSPEQAEMNELGVDTRADVYSLGVLLYELLTGVTPFVAKEILSAGYDEIRRYILNVDPPKPSTRLISLAEQTQNQHAKARGIPAEKLGQALSGDLDWIVMKALEKDRSRRYGAASELAADVNRHLNHEPVEAAAPSALYQVQKFARRHRMLVGFSVLFAFTLIVSALVSGGLAYWARSAEGRADEAKKIEAEQRRRAEEGERLARENAEAAKASEAIVSVERELFYKELYQADMLLVEQAYRQGHHDRMEEILERYWPRQEDEVDHRGFEWFHWWKAAHAHEEVFRARELDFEVIDRPLHSVSVSPDGKSLVAAFNWPRKAVKLSVENLHENVVALGTWDGRWGTLTPDGDWYVTEDWESGKGWVLNLYDTKDWELDRTVITKLSPLTLSDRSLRIEPFGHVQASAFSNSLMALGWRHGHVVILNTLDWEPPGTMFSVGAPISELSFSPDGSLLAAGLFDGDVTVWDVASGKKVHHLENHSSEGFVGVAFHPDGERLLTAGSDGVIHVWDSQFKRLAQYPVGYPITCFQLSADGKWLAAGVAERHQIYVWESSNPEQLRLQNVLRGHAETVASLSFIEGEDRLVSGGEDGAIIRWHIRESISSITVPTDAKIVQVAFSSVDPGLLLMASDDGRLERYDLATRQLLPGRHFSQTEHPIVLSEDGGAIGLVTTNGLPEVWSARTGSLLGKSAVRGQDTFQGRALSYRPTHVSSEGSVLLMQPDPLFRLVGIWRRSHEELGIRLPDVHSRQDAGGTVSLSNDGRLMMINRGSKDEIKPVSQFVSWFSRSTPFVTGFPTKTAFSLDGAYWASGRPDGRILVRDVASRQMRSTLVGHVGGVSALVFSEDGNRIVSGGNDGTVRLWDADSGRPLITLTNPGGTVQSVSLAPLQSAIASAGQDGKVTIWLTDSAEAVNQYADHWVAVGQEFAGARELDQALSTYDEGLRRCPNSQKLLLARADVYERLGRLEESIEDTRRAIEEGMARIDPKFKLAKRLGMVGENRAAARAFIDVLKIRYSVLDTWHFATMRRLLNLGAPVIPMASVWEYRTTEPSGEWTNPDGVPTDGWETGRAPFGASNSGLESASRWGSDETDIWMRYRFHGPDLVREGDSTDLVLDLSQVLPEKDYENGSQFDDKYVKVDLFLNGELMASKVDRGRMGIFTLPEGTPIRSAENVLGIHFRSADSTPKFLEVGLYRASKADWFEWMVNELPADIRGDNYFQFKLGHVYWYQEAWEKGADFFAPATHVESSYLRRRFWVQGGLLYLLAGDRAGFEGLCRRRLAAYRNGEVSPWYARDLAILLLLGANSDEFISSAREILHTLPGQFPEDKWWQWSLKVAEGLLAYRSGEYQAAVQILSEVSVPAKEFNLRSRKLVLTWVPTMLAACYAQLGDVEKAFGLNRWHPPEWRIIGERRDGHVIEEWEYYFHRLLYREAAGLLDTAYRDRNGAVKRWLIAASVPLEGDLWPSTLDEEQIPGEAKLNPRMGGAPGWQQDAISWTEWESDGYVLDFHKALGRESWDCVGYAVTYLVVDREHKDIALHFGYDDCAKAYLNGEPVFRSQTMDEFYPNQSSARGLTLNAGVNVLVYKVANRVGPWKASVWITDPDGHPVPGLTVTTSP